MYVCMYVCKVNIAEFFPRWGIGGGRGGSETELIDICPCKSSRVWLTAACICSVHVQKLAVFFEVLSGNRGNRETETRGEVSSGKPRLFFRLKPLATSRPVLRSSAAWRLKSRTKPLGTRAEVDTQAVFHGKVSWLGMRIETWKHLKRTIKLRLSPLCSGFHLLRY